MVVHGLVPAADHETSNRLVVKVADIIVVGDGDAKFNFIAPGEGGVEFEQGRAETFLAAPSDAVAGRQQSAVVGVVHVNLKTVGTVVRKGEHVGVSSIGRALTNPVRVDSDRRRSVCLNMRGKNRSDQQRHHEQRREASSVGHGWNVGRLPFKTLGHSPQSKVKNITKDEGEDDGGVAVDIEFWRVNAKFPPGDFLIGRRSRVATVGGRGVRYLAKPRP